MSKTENLNVLQILNGDKATRDEVAEVAVSILKAVKELKDELEGKLGKTSSATDVISKNLSSRIQELDSKLSSLASTKNTSDKLLADLKGEIDKLKAVDPTDLSNEITRLDSVVSTWKQDSAIETRDKIESLRDDDRLDKNAVKGLENVVIQPDLDRAIDILDKRTQYLINKTVTTSTSSGTVKTIVAGTNVSVDSTDPANPIVSSTASSTKTYVTVGTANADYLVSNYIDVGDAINAAYAGLPSTGGGIFIQSGTYSYLTPIVFGTNGKQVSLVGGNAASTFLKYTPTSGNAITFNDGDPIGHIVHELTGITLMGKSTLIAAGQTNTNTSIGVYYGGANGAVGINTHDVSINGFGSNVEWGQNAYMLQFNNVAFSGGNGGQASRGSLVHIDAANNSGERNVFTGCSFTDPGNSLATNAIYITSAATASNAFYGCSFDSAQVRIGGSDGTTLFTGCHFENPGSPTSYAEYIPILGVSSDSSTQISVISCEFANSASNQTWTTIIRHGGQLFAAGNHIDNYNGHTVTNFVLHDLDNGLATDYVIQTSVQGGALTNIIGGSGGVAYSLASAATAMYNVSNSYSIGLRANGSNTNEFFSGGTTTGTFDHNGNWTFVKVGSTRIVKRVVTVTQSATPTINTDNTDVASITGLAQAITSFTTNLSGTPVDGDTLVIRITDNGTARAITWGASFEASTVALPTTTVISTMLMVGFAWNTATSKWRCIAVA